MQAAPRGPRLQRGWSTGWARGSPRGEQGGDAPLWLPGFGALAVLGVLVRVWRSETPPEYRPGAPKIHPRVPAVTREGGRVPAAIAAMTSFLCGSSTPLTHPEQMAASRGGTAEHPGDTVPAGGHIPGPQGLTAPVAWAD